MRAATEGSLPPVMPQGNLVEILGREVRQGSPGELMVESSPSCQRRPPCETNKEMSDEAADAAALTYLLIALYMVPFDGKTVVKTGDWRQNLPVVLRGPRAAIVASTLKKGYLWPYFKTLRLTTNIHVEGTNIHAHQEARAFSNWLFNVGQGKKDNPLSMPPDMLLPEDAMESMVDHVFPTMEREDLISGCILAPLNRATDSLNLAAVERLAGEEYVYTSADYFGAANLDDANIYAPELLNKLQPQGMAPNELKLNVGAPIILLGNLNRAEGLMNSFNSQSMSRIQHSS